MQDNSFLPEGYGLTSQAPVTLAQAREQMERGEIVEGYVTRCDEGRALHVLYGGLEGIVPRDQAVSPDISGADRDIALLSRVGRTVRAVITSISVDGGGKPLLMLSRRAAQERALFALLDTCPPGTVLRGRVTHLERYGAFVDIGCGVVALLPLDRLSVSRVDHPRRRVKAGQDILVMVLSVDRERKRFTLSMRELQGTWLENASAFRAGDGDRRRPGHQGVRGLRGADAQSVRPGGPAAGAPGGPPGVGVHQEHPPGDHEGQAPDRGGPGGGGGAGAPALSDHRRHGDELAVRRHSPLIFCQ